MNYSSADLSYSPKCKLWTGWLLKALGFSRLIWNPGILVSHIRISAPGPDAYFSTVNTPNISYVRKASLGVIIFSIMREKLESQQLYTAGITTGLLALFI